MPSGMTPLERAHEIQAETIALRRYFHERPESSLKEYETSAKIKAYLEGLGIPYRAAGETSIVATLTGEAERGDRPAVVALRADIDALEIEEKNDVPYRSRRQGLMHACGHDGHIASLLCAARILKEKAASLSGTVKLIFQAAEEIGTGAQEVIDSGLVDDADAFFGIHFSPSIGTGAVSLRSGPIMAGANSLQIELEGETAHGARPNLGIDAIVAGSAIVQALQEVVAREADPVEPAVVTIGTFNAGTRANIIANRAALSGTLRVMSEERREALSQAVKRVARGVAAAYRVGVKVECEYATPIVINSPELYPIAADAVRAILGEGGIVSQDIEMGTDDFARYGAIAPAFYAKVGVAGERRQYGLHHERFDLDEESLAVAAALHAQFVLSYFAKFAEA